MMAIVLDIVAIAATVVLMATVLFARPRAPMPPATPRQLRRAWRRRRYDLTCSLKNRKLR